MEVSALLIVVTGQYQIRAPVTYYIRELVDRKLVQVKGIPGKENPADIMTKITPMSFMKEWKNKMC